MFDLPFFQGIGLVFDPLNLLMLTLGTFCGVFVGAVPGLNGPMAICMLAPFTLMMPFNAGFIMACGIYCGQLFGGSIAAILFKTPGTEVAAATVIDGYELNRKGQAGKALGTAIAASAIGGLLSLIALVALAPPLAKVALQFGPAEYFSFALLGLAMVSSMAAGSPMKGTLMTVLGLFMSTVGVCSLTGVERFTFGSTQLLSGLSLIPVMIGLYPVAECFTQFKSPTIREATPAAFKTAAQLPTFKELKSLWGTIGRGTLIGTIVGILPGVGGPTAAFTAYGVEVKRSKHPEKFGTGILEGVAAPESANNATSGGAMVPMLTLGIPGSLTTAVMMGLFVIHGLQPGPLMLAKQPEFLYSTFFAMFLSNILMIFAGIFCVKLFVQALRLPNSILYPIIMLISLVGSYSMRNDIFDVWISIAFGVVGYFLQKHNWPLASLIVGLVLGPLVEVSFRSAMLTFDDNVLVFFTRPIAAVFIIGSILSLVWPMISKAIKSRRAATPAGA